MLVTILGVMVILPYPLQMLLSWSRTQSPYAPVWSCRGQKRITMTLSMVPTLIISHLKQLLFS